MTLALFGLTGVPGWTGEAQAANRLTAQPIFAQAPTAFSAIRVNRGTQEKRCPRSADNNCTKDPFPPLPTPTPQ
jgi:hypothetical protein